jgi:hypothetical protein
MVKDQFLTDMFFLSVVQVFRYLHQQVDEIFHQCVNIAPKALEVLFFQFRAPFIGEWCQ